MDESIYRGFVRGYIWKAVMDNDADFQFWTPTKLSREQAVERMLKFANGDEEIYAKNKTEADRKDWPGYLVRIWETKG